MRGGDEQRREWWRQFIEGPVDQRHERGFEPQVPAQRSERDGANGRAILAFVRELEGRIGGAPVEYDIVNGHCGSRERFRTRRVPYGSWRRRRISTTFWRALVHGPNLRPATRTALAKSRAEIGRL